VVAEEAVDMEVEEVVEEVVVVMVVVEEATEDLVVDTEDLMVDTEVEVVEEDMAVVMEAMEVVDMVVADNKEDGKRHTHGHWQVFWPFGQCIAFHVTSRLTFNLKLLPDEVGIIPSK